MTAISTRAISRSTCAPEPPLVQPDNQYLLLSARSPDSIQRYAPRARSASSAPPPPSAAGAPFPSPPTSRYSGACAISPPRAPGAPRSASALPSNIASPTTPRSRVVSLAIAACARTSSIPGATPPFSTSKCSTLAEPRDYAGFQTVRCSRRQGLAGPRRSGRAREPLRALARGLRRDGPRLDPPPAPPPRLVQLRREPRLPAAGGKVPRPPVRLSEGPGRAGAAKVHGDPRPARSAAGARRGTLVLRPAHDRPGF